MSYTLIKLDDIPVGKRFDFWWETVAQSVVSVDASSVNSTSFWAEMRTLDLGTTQLSRVRTSSFDARRTQRRIRQSDTGQYQLSLILRGRSRVRQEYREATLRSTDLVLYDTSRPFHASSMADDTAEMSKRPPKVPSDGFILQFSRDLLPLPASSVERLLAVRLSGRKGVAALLRGMLRQAMQQYDQFSPVEAIRVSTSILDLVTALLSREGGTAPDALLNDPRGVLLLRVKAFIEQRLADVDLTSEMIAAAHHVSIRHLQKLFEQQGLSVASWIRRRRLERCRRDLADPGEDGRSVRAIAARWGFTNDAHFNRAFRAVHGVPPAAYRRHLQESREAALVR
ncbi:AraC family transcriptional regulator [Microtetraspora sp. NBRC 13810]|uniref:AraC-like ligand-binding domain-containing protein n=1 Tax=Microtetraspora sp. NBRC 13810 TaxID=3030990 RepID=UPI0024A26E09|nr:helix-turn-helix domain-containing protein [Microtetraspora sp. NBRC 13810]GLW11549.1 AraC family transcriptional regulator [Microtetraspora sp. NBRC 13810]